jgi:hypothetical protein
MSIKATRTQQNMERNAKPTVICAREVVVVGFEHPHFVLPELCCQVPSVANSRSPTRKVRESIHAHTHAHSHTYPPPPPPTHARTHIHSCARNHTLLTVSIA